MRIRLAVLFAFALVACSKPPADAQAIADRTPEGFPKPDRPVADIVSSSWTSGGNRDVADESGQLIHGLGIAPGMAVADIGAGSGYHTLRLSPAVGPSGVVYAEDIVESYVSGLQREAERRGLKNVRTVVGTADDPKLPRASIDRAVLVHMYHEIENPYALLWRLSSSLKPGAKVGVIDMDRPSPDHGMSPALLRCEFEAVGYRHESTVQLAGGVGYLSIFAAPEPGGRPAPIKIKACAADG